VYYFYSTDLKIATNPVPSYVCGRTVEMGCLSISWPCTYIYTPLTCHIQLWYQLSYYSFIRWII